MSKSKKCGHTDKYDQIMFARICADGSLYKNRDDQDPVAWVCLECKEYAVLGEANDDDPNVQLEIAAAQIVADMNDGGRNVDLKRGWQFGWWLWNDEERGQLERWGSEFLANYPDWEAGWLANEIDSQVSGAACIGCGAANTPNDRCMCWLLYPG